MIAGLEFDDFQAQILGKRAAVSLGIFPDVAPPRIGIPENRVKFWMIGAPEKYVDSLAGY